jgi:hypothetical protein
MSPTRIFAAPARGSIAGHGVRALVTLVVETIERAGRV